MSEHNHFEANLERAIVPDILRDASLSRFESIVAKSNEATGTYFESHPVILDTELVRQKVDAVYETQETEAAIDMTGVASNIATSETRETGVFTTRQATKDDLDTMVAIDIMAFDSVYKEYPLTREELHADIKSKFEKRLAKVDPDWIRVAEEDGELCGFMLTCPTAKKPEDFKSWEDTTDNGTLESTYDPNGPYAYVVSLTMPRPESGDSPKNMLFADQIGKLVQSGFKAGYFESRLPGLRAWMEEKCIEEKLNIDTLSKEQEFSFAQEYATARVERNGKQVLLDPHLRMYESIGCKLVKLAADAYQDAPSMNYGMVAVYENPLPNFMQKNKFMSRAAGSLIRRAARSHKLMKKLF